MSVGVFLKKMKEIFRIKNGRILMLSLKKDASDDMTVSEAGLFNGCTVVIENEDYEC